MNLYRRSIKGVSLLEVMLVLVIGSGIMMMAMSQYQSMRRDSDVEQINFNVDQIFQAAADFYHANCRVQTDPVTGQVEGTGKLDPRYIDDDGNASPPDNPYPITVSELMTAGFMTNTLPLNPLIETSGLNGGYVVQFNQFTPAPDRTVLTSLSTTPVKLGQIIIWRIQVAVELHDVAKAASYKNLLRADCLSTLDSSGTSVTPCSEVTSVPTAAPVYAVWERLPSFAVPGSNSGLWMTNAVNKEFTQLYDTQSIVLLGGLPESSYPQQYYLCGS